MSDKPTYREYKLAHGGRIVKDSYGRRYIVKNFSSLQTTSFFLSFFAIILFVRLTNYFDIFASIPNLFFDLLLILIIFSIIIDHQVLTRIYYSRAEFECADTYFETYGPTPVLRPSLSPKILAVVSVIPLMLFLLLNSYSGLSLISLIGGQGPNTSLTMNSHISDGRTISSADSVGLNNTHVSSTALLPFKNDPDGHASVSTVRTLSSAEFELDGQSIEDVFLFSPITWFWQEDHFVRQYNLTINPDDIRDGSVLSLIGADIHCEWTFDIEPE